MDQKQSQKRKLSGTVVSDKMDKTVVVELVKRKLHPRVKRYINVSKKFLVDNPDNAAKVGDKVIIEETRPLSRLKRWRVIEIKSKAKAISQEQETN